MIIHSLKLIRTDCHRPHMKLHHLLQKCSFFLIKLAVFFGQRRRLYETSYEIPPGRNSESSRRTIGLERRTSNVQHRTLNIDDATLYRF